MKPAILVDIDGTLAHYKEGEHDRPIGEPLDGALAAMELLSQEYRIIIHTSRPAHLTLPWLDHHGFPYDGYNPKPIAVMILDDRALTFEGNWAKTLRKVESFEPWHAKRTSD